MHVSLMNSKAETLSPKAIFVFCKRSIASFTDLMATMHVTVFFGLDANFRLTFVITPNVPSAPIKSCFKS